MYANRTPHICNSLVSVMQKSPRLLKSTGLSYEAPCFLHYTSASESMGIFGLADKWTHIARRENATTAIYREYSRCLRNLMCTPTVLPLPKKCSITSDRETKTAHDILQMNKLCTSDQQETIRVPRILTADRPWTDHGPNTDRPRTVHRPTKDRPRTDHRPTKNRPRTDQGPTMGRPLADQGPTTDRSGTDHGPTTDRPRTDHGPTTDRPQIVHRPIIDRPRTDHRPTTDRPRTDHGPEMGRPRTGNAPVMDRPRTGNWLATTGQPRSEDTNHGPAHYRSVPVRYQFVTGSLPLRC